MCVNIDIYDIKKARNNTKSCTINESERLFLNMLIKHINVEIDRGSLLGKGSITISYNIHNNEIPSKYWLKNNSQTVYNIITNKLTDAGYRIIIDSDFNSNHTVDVMRIYISWM